MYPTPLTHRSILPSTMPKSCQLVLFSATFPDHVREFASRLAPSANEIRLKQEELSVDAIKQFYMDCKSEDHKYEVLVELYNILTIGQSIIFCAKRETADQIAKRMTAEGHKVDSLHGKLEVKDRDATIDNFRSGKAKVLISTNVIARGIDISQVTLVINYDMPTTQSGEGDAETYLHRIGRTGRFGRKGVSINFVHDQKSWGYMNQIEKVLHCSILRVQTEDNEEMERTIKDGECVRKQPCSLGPHACPCPRSHEVLNVSVASVDVAPDVRIPVCPSVVGAVPALSA